MESINVNSIVITDNGEFLIVPIEDSGSSNYEQMFAFGAMYISEGMNYPLEIQIVGETIEEVCERLHNEVGVVLAVTNPNDG